MRVILSVLILVMAFSAYADSRGYVPFIYGTYSQGQRVRIDFERGKKIDRIEFTWSDESENKDSRVELYVDYMYKGSKRIWSSWDSFWVNAEPRMSVELRISRGKVAIRRGYITYALRAAAEDTAYLDFMQNKGVTEEKSVQMLNSMPSDEQLIVLPAILAIDNNMEDETEALKAQYAELLANNADCVNVFELLFGNTDSRGYVFASGYYYNGSTVWLNVDSGRKIRSISVNWRTQNPNDANVTGELYVDGMYEGMKYIRSYSYDTFYLWNKEVRFNMQLRIRGGDIYISSVYVDYAD